MTLTGYQSTPEAPVPKAIHAETARVDCDALASIPRLDLDPEVTYQTHNGFGGAFTEATAVNYAALTPHEKQRFMAGYFNRDTGHGYSLCRVHLNSCDFALGNWACQPSPDAGFTLARYTETILPMIRDAEAARGAPIDLLVSPWSPPAWMKSNGQMNRGGTLLPEYRAAWAESYVRFIELMRAAGFSIWGLTVQNEPEAEQAWDSCLYSAEEERDFIRDHLGPSLLSAGLDDIRIVCWDHNRDHLYHRARTILSDPEAARYVWGSGFHWYMDDCFDNVQAVHDAFPDKGLLFTEGCQEGGPHPDEWSVAERYTRSILNDLRRWTNGWIDWNLALDTTGGPNHVNNLCSAPALVDPAAGTFEWQPSFHALGHFARAIPPGSRRILSVAAFDGLDHLAYRRPDGILALVVHNSGSRPLRWRLMTSESGAVIETPAGALQSWLLSPDCG